MKKVTMLVLLTTSMCGLGYAQLTSTDGTYKTGSTTTNLNLQTGSTNPTTRLTILAANGNVGINNGNPSYRLDVNGTFRAGNFNSTSGIFNVANPSANFALQLNGTQRLTVLSSSGFMGINKNPAYMLDVNGPVNATGFLVNGQPLTG